MVTVMAWQLLLSVYLLFIYLFIHPSIYLPICLSIHVSSNSSISPAQYSFFHLFFQFQLVLQRLLTSEIKVTFKYLNEILNLVNWYSIWIYIIHPSHLQHLISITHFLTLSSSFFHSNFLSLAGGTALSKGMAVKRNNGAQYQGGQLMWCADSSEVVSAVFDFIIRISLSRSVPLECNHRKSEIDGHFQIEFNRAHRILV